MSEISLKNRVAVIGGGAAGYFAAISCAESMPFAEATIFEGGTKTLAKVAVSGGGRCNVTHNCFEPQKLVENYPRGSRELRGPFSKFQPRDTVEWFNKRGVQLKTEADGRMFPVSDNSQTIIDTLEKAAVDSGVRLKKGARIKSIVRQDRGFFVSYGEDSGELFDKVIFATGGAPSGHKLAASLGHTITPTAPSLFTFKVADSRLTDLSGLTFAMCTIKLTTSPDEIFEQRGPILITHWGLSGPGVLKLSAWAARELFAASYRGSLNVNWVGGIHVEQCLEVINAERKAHPLRTPYANPLFGLPRRFWERVIAASEIGTNVQYANLSNRSIRVLAQQLTSMELELSGKGEFKEEFVTCGGVSLREVDLRTMESKVVPGVYFAGEILDIDGVTGGFNFQAAWTTGWIAGRAVASAVSASDTNN